MSIADSFIEGHQAGQAIREHKQRAEDSKLRTMVLKHQLSSLKLDDALRANELQRTYADLTLGQDAPAEGAGVNGAGDSAPAPPAVSAATSSQFGPFSGGYRLPPSDVNRPAPPASIADVVHQSIGSRLRQSFGGSARASSDVPAPSLAPSLARHVVAADPNSGLPPLNLHNDEPVPAGYQDGDLSSGSTGTGAAQDFGDRSHLGMRVSGHRWLQPISIPELGINIPGQWFSAKAAREEEARRAIALKRAEQPLQKTTPGETIYDPYAGKEIYRNTNPKADAPLAQQYDDAIRRGDQSAAARVLASINATRERDPNDEFTREFLPKYARDKLQKPVSALTSDDWAGARAAYAKVSQAPERPSWDITTVNDQATGEDRLVRIDRSTGAVQRVVLPTGTSAGRGKGADDPTLPRGVQSYLLQLRKTYGTDLLGAEKELTAAWPNLTAAHPRISADKAVGALRQQFGSQAGASKFDELLNKMGVDASTLSGGGRGRGGSAPSTAPPAGASGPSASGVVPGATVRLKNGQRVVVRTVNRDGTFDYDPVRP